MNFIRLALRWRARVVVAECQSLWQFERDYKRTETKCRLTRIVNREFMSQAGVANLLSSTCALFAIVLAPALPSHAVSDSFSLTKLVAVVVSVASVAVITTAQSPIETVDSVPVGALWALCGAFFYALYTVVLRHKVSNEDHLNIPMFFGMSVHLFVSFRFVGLFNLLFLWPAFFILDYSQLEHKLTGWAVVTTYYDQLPEACFLTSSLLASLSVSLTIPLTILMDGLLRGVSYPRMFFLGTIPLYLSFVAISVLSHYDSWDPLAELLLRLVRHSVLRKPVIRGSDPLYSEQSQSLIGDQNNSSA
ncbi:unnamed protein product [Oppiella nova]|uniref:Uncharacterized protein n=1 Tax=Oppiella nova TaxID=334625 RepID=A0A7R9QG11_9ACAR|nr:unnamed protein product [Oppiella nova]CAG2164994.1 unnamed protein product [Oppiella nova]